MLRIVATVCLLCSMTLVVWPQSRNRSWLNGTWEGTGYQLDTESTWTMRLNAQGRRYRIEYPSLNCGGEWRLLSIDSRRARFRERITRGQDACVDGGSVVVERLNGRQIAFRFSLRGSAEVSSSAILNRKQ